MSQSGKAQGNCPHMGDCALYKLFTFSGTKTVWQNNYCMADFARCARHALSAENKTVPLNLLPNGELLRKPAPPPKPADG